MCQLCSSDPEERKRAVETHIAQAEMFERVARIYRGMAANTLRPHSDELKRQVPILTQAIRVLVEDWV